MIEGYIKNTDKIVLSGIIGFVNSINIVYTMSTDEKQIKIKHEDPEMLV